MAKIDNWFATQIYTTQLCKASSRLHRDVEEDVVAIYKADEVGRRWSEDNYVGGYTSYSSYSELHCMNTTFMELEKKITKHVMAFADKLDMDLSGRDVFMTDCWVNIMPSYTAHSLHIHPLSFISGTYYVKTPPGSGAIKFEDPRASRFMAAPPKKARAKKENKQYVEYKPSPGKLILFESWLGHEVPATSENEEERVSVSFNYAWR